MCEVAPLKAREIRVVENTKERRIDSFGYCFWYASLICNLLKKSIFMMYCSYSNNLSNVRTFFFFHNEKSGTSVDRHKLRQMDFTYRAKTLFHLCMHNRRYSHIYVLWRWTRPIEKYILALDWQFSYHDNKAKTG